MVVKRTLRGKTTSEENAVRAGNLCAMHHSPPDGLPGGFSQQSIANCCKLSVGARLMCEALSALFGL